MQTTVKKFSLDDDFSILLERDENEKRIYKLDNVLNTSNLMAIYTNEGKWMFPSIIIGNEFFKISKKHSGIIKSNIHKPLFLEYEINLEKQLSCFKRRWNIRILRFLTKIKHII